MRNWEIFWFAGLLVGTVVLVILDALMRAVSIKKYTWRRRRESEGSKRRG